MASLASSTQPVTSALTGRDLELAAQGSVFIAPSVSGTAISGHAAPTTFDETKALFYIYNGSSLTLYPTAYRLKLSNAGTGAATVRFEQTIDIGNRLSSGGTTLVIVGTNGSAGPTGVVATMGAAVLTAPTGARRLLGGAQYRNVIGVVTDQYGFVWGSGGANFIQFPQTSTAGSNELDLVIDYPAIAIPAGYGFAIHQWAASQSGAYQFEPAQFEFVAR